MVLDRKASVGGWIASYMNEIRTLAYLPGKQRIRKVECEGHWLQPYQFERIVTVLSMWLIVVKVLIH